ncbi:PhzF family phenazine biosynthesis isomerase [Gracilibacillus saliphilus]|uniref:PhzF family phenazine biosynthesis isomerase n=1 Tax=Gracilibacillus saliphilus TaxID=543890 RepID=UPI0013D3250D|nr:PhzF family phenazine biosynthesis isomerase [Gracilibacillus saliphilus]
MKSVKVYHYDVFSKKPGKGNPAGVVLNGEELSDAEMQEIAFKVGFNETSFPIKSEVADLKIRFFTPGHEMNLCGHGTMAAVYALKSKGLLGDKISLTIETKSGILPVSLLPTIEDDFHITMKQGTPTFKAFNGSKQELAKAIGLDESDLHDVLPVLYGSTGTWTLLVPIKELKAFQRMKPNNKEFPTILKEMPKASVHPFCVETYDPHADLHARHFSSPYSGTIEDAVTGTASGVMGAYYVTYLDTYFQKSLKLIIEQGYEINKDGRVIVHVSKQKNSLDIEITGSAVLVGDFQVY